MTQTAVLPGTYPSPMSPLPTLFAQAGPLQTSKRASPTSMMRITPRISSMFPPHLYTSAPTVFSSDVESLKLGIVKVSKNKTNAPYNILIVGETGVGKFSVVELIANVLMGNDIENSDLNILDLANEQGGSHNQSQTNLARLYEFKSKNGIVVSASVFNSENAQPFPKVRILDTPGLTDIRGVAQDELHRESNVTQVVKHIGYITAVLVLINGTSTHVTVGIDYALSTLSCISPQPLAKNIAFMFTNVLSPLHCNFYHETLPYVLQDAPRFLIDNPIALQKKYFVLKDRPNMRKGRADFRKAVKAAEQGALVTLVDLFDWLDGLDAQQMTQIAEKSRKIEVKITDAKGKRGLWW